MRLLLPKIGLPPPQPSPSLAGTSGLIGKSQPVVPGFQDPAGRKDEKFLELLRRLDRNPTDVWEKPESFDSALILSLILEPMPLKLPPAFAGQESRIRTLAAEVLVQLTRRALEKNEAIPFRAALERILARDLRTWEEQPPYYLETILRLEALLPNPENTSILIDLLDAPRDLLRSTAADALVGRTDPVALARVTSRWERLLHEPLLGEFNPEEAYGCPTFLTGRPWGRALFSLAPSETLAMEALDSLDAIPLSIERLHEFGLLGNGVRVLVIDCYFHPNHPDFGQRLSVQNPRKGDDDHGTSVASVLGGRAGGVAPAVIIEGYSSQGGTELEVLKSWTHRLQQEVLRAKEGKAHARIVCMSVHVSDSDVVEADRPTFQQQEALWRETCREAEEAGILIFMAVGNYAPGNSGPSQRATKSSGDLPTNSLAESIVRVGAAVPTRWEKGKSGGDFLDGWRRAAYSYLGGNFWTPTLLAPTNRLAAFYEGFEVFTGTSCATPFAAGVAALLLELQPSLTPKEVRALLTESALPLPNANPVGDGAGLIQPVEAVRRLLKSSSPERLAALDFLLQQPTGKISSVAEGVGKDR